MNRVHTWVGLMLSATVAFAACGGDDEGGGSGGGNNTTGTGTGTATGTGSGGGSATGTGAGSGTGTGTGSATGTGTGSGTPSGTGDCDTWLVSYDLTGSVFFIDSIMDFTITLEEPYDADLNMGPGSITLRFPDVGGAPGEGPLAIVDYQMTQNFVTGISSAEVTTTLATSAVDACGVADGSYAADTASWSPAEMQPYCRDGQVACAGALCGIGGSPQEGQPLVFNNDCSEPMPLNDFVFTSGIDAFTMAAVVTSQDSNQTSTMAFVGTKVSEELDPAPPGCACN